MNLLFDDSKRNPSLEPLSRFHSFFEWNLGGVSLLEKLERKYPGAKIFYKGPNPFFEKLIFQRYPHILPANLDTYDSIYSSDSYLPWELLGTVTSIIEDTLNLEKDWKRFRQKYKAKQAGFHIVGKDKHLYIHPGATIYPGVVFDTTHGPILIEDGAKISSFSFLEGPLFVGKNTQIDNARITGGCLIGNQCRIGGEVENSILLDYTNKHHEGFLGHSFVSTWVNLGALSTTSDLKNNYGIVKLKIGDSVVNTGTIKFGSLIGPFTKLAIGVMSNTGTVFDIASNIVESRIQGYVSAFTWIKHGGRYRLEEFLFDTKKIMARRGMNLFEFEEEYLRKLYGSLTE
ncbi:GlmU family protein [Leptospira sp. 2 VSF19]|uniref:GlmU family protein n=1 Tax=Leptospira soteropolitanensis TaxID=2950025 RepID=A0AAW5VFK4_9LEPT|nr:GlmU family protein [Leptospira soteropolitanensis]MCW7494080.1 GlmU family protein [Leptospira soteropolitanensis]MCW7501654.1 GlmU family protein [Leptospira soteropolitanensis]MCW7523926.1 GlmU family protein [Leptospira soteropolitanensis]MCW7527791.1 GlmU family protein [Leptospira soteropolitanensis]MCW7531624.1 GlmU family protein [Leptospira soteropolitanensis]